jgi:hypothetical protein
MEPELSTSLMPAEYDGLNVIVFDEMQQLLLGVSNEQMPLRSKSLFNQLSHFFLHRMIQS